MTFTPKDWKDGVAGGTKLNAAALEDLEKRVADYADTIGAASQPLDSDLSAIAALSTTSYGRAFLGLADAAAGRTALGLGSAATQASSAFQASDADLTAMAALTTSEFGRSLLTMANAGAARTALSVPSVAELEAHLGDAVDAHDASAISYAGGPGMSAVSVEAAVDELATEAVQAGRQGLAREELPLAMFPSEHGWTGNGTGSFSDAGGELILNSDRSFKIETNGAGAASIATSPALTAVDLTDKHVVFHSQLSFGSRLKTVKLRLASGNIATDYAEVTVWSEEDDAVALQSTWERQSFPTGAFAVTGTVDWAAITKAQIIVTDNSSGKFTLYVAGVYAVPTKQQATVSIAFDDNYASVFSSGLPRLSRYRFPASVYAIVDLVGSGGRLTLAQLKTLRDQHGWEIAGHAYTAENHNLSSGLDSIATTEGLEAELDGLKAWLDDNGFRRATFAYPKGSAKADKARPYVTRDFGAGRSTAPGPETVPPRDDYTLRGWSVNGLTQTATTLKAAIDKAISQGSWLILTFHDLVAGAPAAATEFKASEFNEVVDYVRAKQAEGKDLEVRTVADAMGAQAPGNGPAATTWHETKVFTVPDEIKVASGDTDFIPPMALSAVRGQTSKVVKVIHWINGGTSATFKLQVDGSDLTGFTGIEAKTTAAVKDPTDQKLEPGEKGYVKLAPVVTAVSGTPKNLTVAVVIEHTVL